MKTTTYKLNLYHFGDESVKGEHGQIVDAIQDLLPDADVNVEPVKSDHWQLVIEVDA